MPGPLTDELFSLRGKAALVTGGSRGIGEMIARGLVEAGVRTYIASRKKDACDATAEALREYGECVSLPADLASDDGARRLAAEVRARESALHILVNNAGATWGAPLTEYPGTAFDRVWSVNVKAPFRLTVELLPALRAAASDDDPARVVNIGSIDGLIAPASENYAYGASKAAIHHLTRHLAHRLAGERITVNAIAPGPFHTKMLAFVLDDERGRAAMASRVPLGRIGRPSDLAGTTIFLCSRAGSFLTGAVIPVDGGISGTAGG